MDRRSGVLLLCLFAFELCTTTELKHDNPDNESGSTLFFYQDQMYPRDYKEVEDQCTIQNSTGAHLVQPDGYHKPFWVFCSGEWTVFQRRFDGIIDFNNNWTEYRNGFGYPNVDHWLGNEKLSYLINQKVYELRIDIETKTGIRAYISYGEFRVNDEYSNYSLVSLGQRSGTDESVLVQCPPNMIYDNCSRCIATCADPSGTVNCPDDCDDSHVTCTCPPYHLMNVTDCVRREQCGCYKTEYGVIADNSTYVTSDCSEKCTCRSGILTCTASVCAQEATCEVEGGVRNCFCNGNYEGDGQTCTLRAPVDCYDIWLSGNTANGDYTITPPGWTGGPFTVNCNMTIDGGKWTVIQRRIQGSSRLDFNKDWEMYEKGFGTPSREFWIGNKKLYHLTNQREYELRIDMVTQSHTCYYAKYDLFRITGESDNYRLKELGSFTGFVETGFDALRSHQNMSFSTPDRDNDLASYNCADTYDGGWWFHTNACYYCALNAAYSSSYTGWWFTSESDIVWLLYTEMKIRLRVSNQ